MVKAAAIDTTNLPITRRDVESQIDALIDLLDTIDPDPDLEPSLGFTEHLFNLSQDGPSYAGNANGGDDRELDDEREPDADGEASLGWRNEGSQTGQWNGNPLVGTDLEDGVGPVRKKRPPSKTGRWIMTGGEVFR